MPQKKPGQSERTPARGSRSSDMDALAKQLRSDYSNRIGEIASAFAWFAEKNQNLPASVLGPRLDRRIVKSRNGIRELITDFVLKLCMIISTFKSVEREAAKAWPLFNAKVAHFITASDMEGWESTALAEARGKSKRGRQRSLPDARKIHVALIKRKHPQIPPDNGKLCQLLDAERVSVVQEWNKGSWEEVWADIKLRRKASRYLSGIKTAPKPKRRRR